MQGRGEDSQWEGEKGIGVMGGRDGGRGEDSQWEGEKGIGVMGGRDGGSRRKKGEWKCRKKCTPVQRGQTEEACVIVTHICLQRCNGRPHTIVTPGGRGGAHVMQTNLYKCTYTTHQFSAQVNTDACVCVHEATQ